MEQRTEPEITGLPRAQTREARLPVDTGSCSALNESRFPETSKRPTHCGTVAGDVRHLCLEGGEYLPIQVELRADWRSAIKSLIKWGDPTIAVCHRDQNGPAFALLELCGPRRIRISVESPNWCDENVLTAFIEFHCLTPRESEVFRALAEGLKTKAIAIQSNCQPSTIKCHIKSILTKTNERNMNDVLLRLAGLSRGQPASSVEINIR